MTMIYAKVISGALGLSFGERYGFRVGTTTFWEIFPEFILLIPHTTSCRQEFYLRNVVVTYPPVMNQVLFAWLDGFEGFWGSRPCFVSLVFLLKRWTGPKATKISQRTQSYLSI